MRRIRTIKTVVSVVGTRPNFMKLAPIAWELQAHKRRIRHIIVHTGQHYDDKMSDSFFRELSIPKPHVNLNVGSGTHAVQTAQIMIGLEAVFKRYSPDLLLIVGDVNSTLAAALVASKMGIPIAHIEAGLRSGDWSMPEEINRVITDRLSQFLFTHEADAAKNLIREGVDPKRIFFAGNIMIDSLRSSTKKAKTLDLRTRYNLQGKKYAVVTLHRPSNVDHKLIFEGIIRSFIKIQQDIHIVWPIHPRTLASLKRFNLLKPLKNASNISILPPASYLEFLHLMLGAKFVMTDSGGIQEETTALGIPCLTIRENTERPITITQGTNTLVGVSPTKIVTTAKRILAGHGKEGIIPKYWDGHTARRILNHLLDNVL